MTTKDDEWPAEAVERSGAGTRARLARLPWAAIGAVGGGSGLIAAHASVYGNWLIDDAGLTFAYARSIAKGLGPVLQPGADPVEAYSNPSWLFSLILGRLLGLFDHGTILGIPDYVFYPKALALGFCAAILAICYGVAQQLTKRAGSLTLVVGAVLAAIPSFVIWSFSGLENSLYALTVVALAALLIRTALSGRLLSRRVAVTAGLLALVAALTRPDGVIYAAAYPVVVLLFVARGTLLRTMSRGLLSCVIFVVSYGGFVAWRYGVFGALVPNTAVAKRQDPPTIDDLSRTGDLLAYVGWLAVLTASVCLALQLGRPSQVRRALVVGLVPLALALVAYCVLDEDWMGQYRYATPIWALGAMLGTFAIWTSFSAARIRGRVAIALALSLAVLLSGQRFYEGAREFRADPTVPLCYVADRFGRVFNGYADQLGLDRASFLVPDLGGTVLTSRLELVDLAGLADPRFARFHAERDMASLRDHVFDVAKPVFIHGHNVWSDNTGLATDERMERDYYKIVGGSDPESYQDWVRKDAVTSREQLERLRRYADETVEYVDNSYARSPLSHCGATLRPGQTRVVRG